MKRWIARPCLWALPALSLLTAPAGAQSITCFGSIIVTSLGTEGISIQVPDGMAITTTPGTDAAFAPDPKAIGGGPATVDIRPLPPIKTLEPMPNERGDTPAGGGSGGGAGMAQTGQTDPAVSEMVDPLVPVDTPLEAPPIDPAVTTDPPPPTVDDPILTTTVDVPAAPTTPEFGVDDPIVTIDDNPVLDTPEPATVTLLGLAGVGALVARRKRRPA